MFHQSQAFVNDDPAKSLVTANIMAINKVTISFGLAIFCEPK